ncbi:MAG: formylglycine-generating enzyme family protein [Gammaproteobacteria bacterium]|nr:formylglycine-generating enzyme family protein [Gammaproteobacteria bacterium]
MKKYLPIAIILGVAAILGYLVAMDDGSKTGDTSASMADCRGAAEHGEMVWIEGDSFTRGATGFYPDEGPPEEIRVGGFWIDRFEVTNARFGEFVDATGYVTVAETQPDPEDFPGIDPALLQPGAVVFTMPTDPAGNLTQWWRFVPGANWREPGGPGSSIEGLENYPVVHVTYQDAKAFAEWLGHDLPTEVQWEYAARGGLDKAVYAWGDEFLVDGRHQANTWQGVFPVTNAEEDTFPGSAPVGCFPANGYGLYDMIGNVWEWIDDWYYPVYGTQGSGGHDPRQPGMPVKVIKGGSYLCADNYCRRYRPAARHAQETTLGAAHIGFRTVRNAN